MTVKFRLVSKLHQTFKYPVNMKSKLSAVWLETAHDLNSCQQCLLNVTVSLYIVKKHYSRVTEFYLIHSVKCKYLTFLTSAESSCCVVKRCLFGTATSLWICNTATADLLNVSELKLAAVQWQRACMIINSSAMIRLGNAASHCLSISQHCIIVTLKVYVLYRHAAATLISTVNYYYSVPAHNSTKYSFLSGQNTMKTDYQLRP